MAINDPTHTIPHNSYFPSVHASLNRMGYTTIKEYYDDVQPYDGDDLMLYLCSSSVLVLMTHGAPTLIEMSNGTTVSYMDIMDLSADCLSDLELVVLASCYTGQGYPSNTPPQNFAEALAEQGARNVIAFKDQVYCDQVILWMEVFFAALAGNDTYQNAFAAADEVVKTVDIKVNGISIQSTDAAHRVYIH